jgi:hypothetical protein
LVISNNKTIDEGSKVWYKVCSSAGKGMRKEQGQKKSCGEWKKVIDG